MEPLNHAFVLSSSRRGSSPSGLLRQLTCFAFLFTSLPVLAQQVHSVRLSQAPFDRAGQVLTLRLPDGFSRNAALRYPDGRRLELQMASDGTAAAIVPWQKAGATLVFELVANDAPVEVVRPRQEKGALTMEVAGKPVLTYRMDANDVPRTYIKPEVRRAGYLHPIYSPAGEVVTDDYPENHAWHHGVWTPWTKTTFRGREIDFWNSPKKTGREDFERLEKVWEGPVHGGFQAQHRVEDITGAEPVRVLDQTWTVTVYDLEAVKTPARLFDLQLLQTAATLDPLFVETYHYGGFGIRGAGEWNGPGEAARFLTSEGVSDRIAGNNTRVRWCYLGGRKGAGWSGTAVLGHPGNLNAPQPVRLHPNFPYFSLVPQQLGGFAISAENPYQARFRFIVFDGEPDADLIEAYWRGFAGSANVIVEMSP